MHYYKNKTNKQTKNNYSYLLLLMVKYICIKEYKVIMNKW